MSNSQLQKNGRKALQQIIRKRDCFVSRDGKYEAKKIVGSFHTHPNVGIGWKQEPSFADVNFVKKNRKTKEKVYLIDSSGAVLDVGRTREILYLM